MGNKLYAKFVIAAGVLLMMYARRMDVTHDGVFNFHLMSQQNSTMMFGGFVFLGGLILFAVARMKQTPEDEAKEIDAKSIYTEEMMQKGKEFASSASDIAFRSSESAISFGKDSYAKHKGKLKAAASIIGGVVVVGLIAVKYLATQEKKRLDEIARAEAELAQIEDGRRFQFFKNSFASGKFLGYSFGEKNLRELAVQLGRHDYKPESTVQIKCNDGQCNSLIGYSEIAPAMEGIQFEFCTNSKSAISDPKNEEGYVLTKIEFLYKKDTNAKTDFENLKAESYQFRQIDAETAESVEYMPYYIWIARKRGQWNVCGDS